MTETNIVWLTKDLKEKISNVFESKYGRILTEPEIVEISENITNLMTIIMSSHSRKALVYGNDRRYYKK